MKKVSMVDTAAQTDPITILDSAVQSNKTNTNSQTEELQKQKVHPNTINRNQTKTPIEEKNNNNKKKKKKKKKKKNRGWSEKGHHGDDKKKDLKGQQQKEKQARSQSSPSGKDQAKIKSSQGTQKQIPSNRERKCADDVIQQHNRFGSLSDSSDDME